LLAARLMARMMAGSADLALITQTNDALPAGRDRLARTTALLSASIIFAVMSSSNEFESADKAFADLAWPALSFACMWRDVAEVLLLRANGTDLGRLRSATDALVAKARAAADFEIVYSAYGSGAASTMPWHDNVDRAIVEARDLVTLALTSKLVIVGGLNLSALAARMAIALCERAHPGDLDEARQILLELDRRFGLIHVLQRYALLWYSAAAHQPLTRARVLGWFRRLPLNRLYEAGDPLLREIAGAICAALPPQALAQALEEGARLSDTEAIALALCVPGADGLQRPAVEVP
jgi:hypothetical protein